jgi:hypothetical protein
MRSLFSVFFIRNRIFCTQSVFVEISFTLNKDSAVLMYILCHDSNLRLPTVFCLPMSNECGIYNINGKPYIAVNIVMNLCTVNKQNISKT